VGADRCKDPKSEIASGAHGKLGVRDIPNDPTEASPMLRFLDRVLLLAKASCGARVPTPVMAESPPDMRPRAVLDARSPEWLRDRDPLCADCQREFRALCAEAERLRVWLALMVALLGARALPAVRIALCRHAARCQVEVSELQAWSRPGQT
jgi:hypothetical protein